MTNTYTQEFEMDVNGSIRSAHDPNDPDTSNIVARSKDGINWTKTEVSKTDKMTPVKFKALLNELDHNSVETLAQKNARYAKDGDCLHNFRSGGDILGGTSAQACWGYLTKHLVALRDMVEKDDFSNREDFLEKCQDSINYIRFLWCIGNDNK